LKRYLDKIRQNQPINYPAFLKTLPVGVRRRHRDIFQPHKVSANRWRVDVVDQRAFDALQARAAAPQSRIQAAHQGDSHRHGTGVSFLLFYHHRQATSRPDTVVLSGTDTDMGFTPAPCVLVVENERNFYHFREVLAFARDTAGADLALSNCDVVLGAGNRVTGAETLAWLDRSYQQVLCAFDFDAGGLQMFATVAGALGHKAGFVQPADWQPWLGHFRKTPNTTERFTKAVSLAEDLGFTSLAQAFRATGKFMEQEMILDE